MNRLSAYLKKDGWLLAALLVCVALCLLAGTSGSANTTEEARLSRVLGAIEGAGQVEVAIYYEDSIPCGAVIVADGAGDAAVHLRLVSAVTTLLGVEQDRVAVYARNGGQ